jgi:hypothetical protein
MMSALPELACSSAPLRYLPWCMMAIHLGLGHLLSKGLCVDCITEHPTFSAFLTSGMSHDFLANEMWVEMTRVTFEQKL